DVHDVAVALDLHDAGQGDRAGPGDLPDIVPPQVHQHDVLGPLLGVGQELALQGGILFWGCAPPARAGQGAAGEDVAISETARQRDRGRVAAFSLFRWLAVSLSRYSAQNLGAAGD